LSSNFTILSQIYQIRHNEFWSLMQIQLERKKAELGGKGMKEQ
jgi:hypothetical protein